MKFQTGKQREGGKNLIVSSFSLDNLWYEAGEINREIMQRENQFFRMRENVMGHLICPLKLLRVVLRKKKLLRVNEQIIC